MQKHQIYVIWASEAVEREWLQEWSILVIVSLTPGFLYLFLSSLLKASLHITNIVVAN